MRVPAGGAAAGSSFSGEGSAVACTGGDGEGDPWDMAYLYEREREIKRVLG